MESKEEEESNFNSWTAEGRMLRQRVDGINLPELGDKIKMGRNSRNQASEGEY